MSEINFGRLESHPRIPGPETVPFNGVLPSGWSRDRVLNHNWQPQVIPPSQVLWSSWYFYGGDVPTVPWLLSTDPSKLSPENRAQYAFILAVTYDHAYPDLSPETRVELQRKGIATLAAMAKMWQDQDFSHYNSYAYSRMKGAQYWLAVSVLPDVTVDDAGKEWADAAAELWNFWVNNFIEAVDVWKQCLDGGLWPEGTTYQPEALRTIYMTSLLVKTAYSTDLLYYELSESALAFDRCVEPDGSAVPFGDCHTQRIALGPGSMASHPVYAAILGRRANLPPWGGNPAVVFPWSETLVGIPGRLPNSWRSPEGVSQGAGLAAFTPSWGKVSIWTGTDPNVSHSNPNAGHFEIWADGLIVGNAHGYAYGATSQRVYGWGKFLGWNVPRIWTGKNTTQKTLKFTGLDQKVYEAKIPPLISQKLVGSGYSSKPRNRQEWLARRQEFEKARIINVYEGVTYRTLSLDLSPSYQTFPGAEAWQAEDRVEFFHRHFVITEEGVLVIDRYRLLPEAFDEGQGFIEWPFWTRYRSVFGSQEGVQALESAKVQQWHQGLPSDFPQRYRNAADRKLAEYFGQLDLSADGVTYAGLGSAGAYPQAIVNVKFRIQQEYPTPGSGVGMERPENGPAESCAHSVNYRRGVDRGERLAAFWFQVQGPPMDIEIDGTAGVKMSTVDGIPMHYARISSAHGVILENTNVLATEVSYEFDPEDLPQTEP